MFTPLSVLKIHSPFYFQTIRSERANLWSNFQEITLRVVGVNRARSQQERFVLMLLSRCIWS